MYDIYTNVNYLYMYKKTESNRNDQKEVIHFKFFYGMNEKILNNNLEINVTLKNLVIEILRI